MSFDLSAWFDPAQREQMLQNPRTQSGGPNAGVEAAYWGNASQPSGGGGFSGGGFNYSTAGGNSINQGGAQTNVDVHALAPYVAQQAYPQQHYQPQPWGYGYQQQPSFNNPFPGVKGISPGPRGNYGINNLPSSSYGGGGFSGGGVPNGWMTGRQDKNAAADYYNWLSQRQQAEGTLGAASYYNWVLSDKLRNEARTPTMFYNPDTVLVAPWAQHDYNGPPQNLAEAFGLNAQNAAIMGQRGGDNFQMFDPWADMQNPYRGSNSYGTNGLAGGSYAGNGVFSMGPQYDQFNIGNPAGIYQHQAPYAGLSPSIVGERINNDWGMYGRPFLTDDRIGTLAGIIGGAGGISATADAWRQIHPGEHLPGWQQPFIDPQWLGDDQSPKKATLLDFEGFESIRPGAQEGGGYDVSGYKKVY